MDLLKLSHTDTATDTIAKINHNFEQLASGYDARFHEGPLDAFHRRQHEQNVKEGLVPAT